MGQCLGKANTSAAHTSSNETGVIANGRRHSQSRAPVKNLTMNPTVCLQETVSRCIQEILQAIGHIVDNEPETPPALSQLHDIMETPWGWIQLVKSLIEIVPADHPMTPSVFSLLLYDSPLPTRDCVTEVAEMVADFKHDYGKMHRERNFCIIIGCLAERLSGPNNNALLTEETLQYLFRNLETDTSKDVILFSIIALEKFAKTNENKEFIKNKLKALPSNPLLKLEAYCDSCTDFTYRQIGFCARWCLDNYFCIDDRKYSFETVDVENINAMLNVRDVSEYLKISPDGIEARCDEYSFESVRCTYQVDAGRWYHEVLIITPGVMQIGYATKESRFLSQEGYGIGDDHFSISFDGCRQRVWYKAKSMEYNLPAWRSGSILGCLLDLDKREIVFSMDGVVGEPLNYIFDNVTTGFFAAASFMLFQQCRFNFGTEPFRYPPTDVDDDDAGGGGRRRPFRTFNDCGHIEDKTILPRHLYLSYLRKTSIKEDSCTICFDVSASIRIEPCNHSGYCFGCAKQLVDCPMCRGPILAIVPDINTPPVTS